MIRTLIIDDEPIALEKLHNYVAKTPFLTLAGECRDGFEALEFTAANEVDLIITDINMPDLNGLEFIRTLDPKPMAIFTTAHPQYALESYSVSAVDYLLKPFGFADFHRAVQKAQALHDALAIKRGSYHVSHHEEERGTGQPESLFVKVDYRYVRVSLADIRFIKGYGEYLQIFVRGKSAPLVTLSSFAAVRERLTEDFLQVHRSYIVNMNHVEQIERSRLIMDAENVIPVSDSFKQAFQQYLATRAVGKIPAK
jgi:DNA-binding LytR/AlgR family response regulator